MKTFGIIPLTEGSFYVNCPSQSIHHLRFSTNFI